VPEEPSTDTPGNAETPEPQAAETGEAGATETGEARATETAEADAAPQSAPRSAPPSAPARNRLRWLPQLRRTSLRVRIIAAVVAAAVIAAVVFLVIPSSPAKPAYTSLPAACTMVSQAALARYLPSPTGTPVSIAAPAAVKTGSCKWSSTAGGEDRTLWLTLFMTGGPSAVGDAQQSYDATLSGLDCHCEGITESTRRVDGLGDQAAATLVTTAPDAGLLPGPGADLFVWSSNAEMVLAYNATAAETLQSPDAAELTWLISVAHDVLADLARPATLVAAPVIPEPHYAGSRDPCRLISGTTLARYAPGATVSPGPTSSGGSPNPVRLSSCLWSSSSVSMSLNLTVYPDASFAGEGFGSDIQAFSRNDASTTVAGTRWLEGLGEDAVAIFKARSSSGPGVEMLVWSGNIELDYSFNVASGPRPSSATLLAAGLAMARDGLAALASPSASSYLPEPMYASPNDACTLIRASTLARYAPGASLADNDLSPAGDQSGCSWQAQDGSLILFVNTYSDADGALGGYEYDVQPAHLTPAGNTLDGVQPVKGLGAQATAAFETFQGYPEVDLYVLSGNAEIHMSFTDLPFSPTLSRAQELAAEIAMVRDVLADLPR
jgi:hypothetical protein